jgi:hypothetical protein
MKIGIILLLAVSLVGLIVFGTVNGLTETSGLNQIGDYDSYYKYEITLVQREEMDSNGRSSIDPSDPDYDPLGQQDYVKAVEENKDKVIDVVEDTTKYSTDYKITDAEITKNEENVQFSYLQPDQG